MSIWVIKDNCGRFCRSETLEEQEAFVSTSFDELVIRISSFNVMSVVIIMVISVMIIVVTASEGSHLS